MNASHLHVLKAPEPTLANRARLAQLQAQAAAAEHIEALVEALELAARLAEEVADGGDIYPVGVRELARTFRDQPAQRAVSIRAIVGRQPR